MRLILPILVLTLWVISAVAEPDTAVDSTKPQVQIKIESVRISNMVAAETVDVMLTAADSVVAGFDLKIGTESRAFEIVSVQRGELIDSCRWEFFNARKQAVEPTEGVPMQVWRVTGLIKSSPDDSQPVCFGLGRPASICRLVISSAGNSAVPDQVVPIFFYWEGCRDNVVSDLSGQKMMISALVSNPSSDSSTAADPSDGFPNRTGHPDDCIDLSRKNHPIRAVDFVNGVVEFKADFTPKDSSESKAE